MQALVLYKFFKRSYLDHGAIDFDKHYNKYFTSKLERVQHKACLAIASAIQSTFHERLNKELSLESINDSNAFVR